MPKATSKKQQMAAGVALSAKRGEESESELQGASRGMYESMSEEDLEEMAGTKRKSLPTKRTGSGGSRSASRRKTSGRGRSSNGRKSSSRRKSVERGRSSNRKSSGGSRGSSRKGSSRRRTSSRPKSSSRGR